jgi:hypothetical protein
MTSTIIWAASTTSLPHVIGVQIARLEFSIVRHVYDVARYTIATRLVRRIIQKVPGKKEFEAHH